MTEHRYTVTPRQPLPLRAHVLTRPSGLSGCQPWRADVLLTSGDDNIVSVERMSGWGQTEAEALAAALAWLRERGEVSDGRRHVSAPRR